MVRYCNESKILSSKVWNYCTDVFDFNLKVSEVGLTYHLIYDITSFYGKSSKSCEVYCIQAKHEKTRGADIDLFIQDSTGNYYFFMLQAKVMDYKGRYNHIAKWNPNAQYNTLIKASKKENALALYLLYNGKTVNSIHGNQSLGISIMLAKSIKDKRYGQFKSKHKSRRANLDFDTLFPLGMWPYSTLFCELPEMVHKSTSKALKRGEIYTTYPYVRISELDISNGQDNDSVRTNTIERNLLGKNLSPFRIILNYED